MKSPVQHVKGGTGAPVVVVDFLRFDSRPSLTHVLHDRLGSPLFRLDPVTDLDGRLEFPTLPQLADDYADAVEHAISGEVAFREDVADAVIVGFCNASTLAVMIADRLLGSRPATRCVVVDPTWPTAPYVAESMRELRAGLGAASASADADPAAQLTLDAMVDILRADVSTALHADGVSDDEAQLAAEALLPRYRAWLGFLGITAGVTPPSTVHCQALCRRDRPLPPWWPPTWETTVVPELDGQLLLPDSEASRALATLIGVTTDA